MENKTITKKVIKRIEVIKTEGKEDVVNTTLHNFKKTREALAFATNEVSSLIQQSYKKIEVSESEKLMKYRVNYTKLNDGGECEVEVIVYQQRASKYNIEEYLNENNEYFIFNVSEKITYKENKKLNSERIIHFLMPKY